MNLARLLKNLARDLRYGQFLGGVKKTPFGDTGAYDTANSDYAALEEIFADELPQASVLVDVGCGKGRVLNYWLSRFPGSRIVGIELDPEVASETAKRLSRYRNVEIRCGDACQLLPPETTLVYMFNPFSEPVMKGFLAAVRSCARASRRNIRIVYYNPMHVNVFKEAHHCSVSSRSLRAPHHGLYVIDVQAETD
ncbi:class I SAM-dependent methyltransferase [Massilia arenosa]|uniref:Class I SAM-dependent methyltransferase n=1 Tax=Zemynaea arenosa TaxID=2561931 RepID=A0A4Y9S9F8_9BURK|nr:class I SAM-dependent methyltransferase [Massilia arenosa]TFW16751.1 class I SAM-dependent methyltransferase [Massilia arenosa]